MSRVTHSTGIDGEKLIRKYPMVRKGYRERAEAVGVAPYRTNPLLTKNWTRDPYSTPRSVLASPSSFRPCPRCWAAKVMGTDLDVIERLEHNDAMPRPR